MWETSFVGACLAYSYFGRGGGSRAFGHDKCDRSEFICEPPLESSPAEKMNSKEDNREEKEETSKTVETLELSAKSRAEAERGFFAIWAVRESTEQSEIISFDPSG